MSIDDQDNDDMRELRKGKRKLKASMARLTAPDPEPRGLPFPEAKRLLGEGAAARSQAAGGASFTAPQIEVHDGNARIEVASDDFSERHLWDLLQLLRQYYRSISRIHFLLGGVTMVASFQEMFGVG